MTSRLITLVIMIGLAVALYSYARREDMLNAPRPTSGLLYPGLDPQSIDSLYLGMEAGQYLKIERQPGGPWRITQPTDERAHAVLVEQVLDNLMRATVQPVETAGAPVRAEDVGLEPPRYQIRFGHGDHFETLLLGEVEPLGTHVYARRVGDDQVVLTTRNIINLLQQHGESFVDPSLFRGLSGAVDHVRVEEPDRVIVDARRVADRWTLHEPLAALADETRVGHLVRSLQFMKRSDVLRSRPDAQQLRELGLPDMRSLDGGRLHGATLLEVGSPGEQPVRVWLQEGWRTQDGSVAVLIRDPWKVVEVDRAALAVASNETSWFREHHLLPPMRERAASLRVERDGAALFAVSAGPGGAWTFSSPARLAGEVAESTRFEGHSPLLDLLARLDAIEVRDFCDPPDGDPIAQIAVGWTRTGQSRIDRVMIYPAREDGLVPARTTERLDEGLLLPPEVMDLFDIHQPDLLRSLSPLHVDEARWARLVIRHPDLPAPLELAISPETGEWTGDDVWGRRFGLAHDLRAELRGRSWQVAPEHPTYPWRVEFQAADGTLLAGLGLRKPGPGEPQETFGVPAAFVALDARPGVELVVPGTWVERVDELSGPQLRKP